MQHHVIITELYTREPISLGHFCYFGNIESKTTNNRIPLFLNWIFYSNWLKNGFMMAYLPRTSWNANEDQNIQLHVYGKNFDIEIE